MRFDFEKKSAAPQRKSSFFDSGNLTETVFDSSDMGRILLFVLFGIIGRNRGKSGTSCVIHNKDFQYMAVAFFEIIGYNIHRL